MPHDTCLWHSSLVYGNWKYSHYKEIWSCLLFYQCIAIWWAEVLYFLKRWPVIHTGYPINVGGECVLSTWQYRIALIFTGFKFCKFRESGIVHEINSAKIWAPAIWALGNTHPQIFFDRFLQNSYSRKFRPTKYKRYTVSPLKAKSRQSKLSQQFGHTWSRQWCVRYRPRIVLTVLRQS